MKSSLKTDNNAVTVGSGFSHTVWYPKNVDPKNPNTASLVTTLSYNGFKMLFGGDLPNSGWESLLTDESFRKAISGTSVFKVPHHGRKEGCSESLFKHIKPLLCIISDKPLDSDNENTASTDWYTQRSSGANIRGLTDKRKVLTTRKDKSIFIEVTEDGTWSVFTDTKWRKD